MNRLFAVARLLLIALLAAACALPLGGCTVAEASRNTTQRTQRTKPVELPEWGSPDMGDASLVDGLQKGTVTDVVDGDTARIKLENGDEEKVRFIGVDTPESTKEHEPYGEEASAYTKRSLLGKTVWLEQDAEARDRYGRLLAYIWMEEPADRSDAEVRYKMFNARLALEGYAQQMTIPPNVLYADHFTKYVKEAREANKGLWGLPAGAGSVSNGSGSGVNEPITMAYVANRRTGKFHRSNCESVQKMNPTNRVPYETREQVVGDGYIPCKICNP